MKRILLCLLALIAIVACSKGDGEGQQGGSQNKQELVLESSSVDFSSDGGSRIVSFTAGGA